MKASEFLIAHGWCQGDSAQDANGNPVGIQDKTAVSFCVLGAIRACMGSEDKSYKVMTKLRKHLKVGSAASWNDTFGRTKTEVVAALEAIGE